MSFWKSREKCHPGSHFKDSENRSKRSVSPCPISFHLERPCLHTTLTISPNAANNSSLHTPFLPLEEAYKVSPGASTQPCFRGGDGHLSGHRQILLFHIALSCQLNSLNTLNIRSKNIDFTLVSKSETQKHSLEKPYIHDYLLAPLVQ